MSIRPRKSLGQHFLVDPNIQRKIVASLSAGPEDPVVEIGPGVGALTGLLKEAFPTFCAIEVDDRAVAHLAEILPGVDVREMDVLKADWPGLYAEFGRPLFVIGNLPYNITSPILFDLLAAHQGMQEAVLMMQLEVAARLAAKPRTKQYGILSVMVQLFAEARLLFKVSPNVFRPRPDVDSAVIKLEFKPDLPAFLLEHTEDVRLVVRSAFNMRRKTLRNSLKRVSEQFGRPVPENWSKARAEELSPEEFLDLTRHFVG